MRTDVDVVVYRMLANDLIHGLFSALHGLPKYFLTGCWLMISFMDSSQLFMAFPNTF